MKALTGDTSDNIDGIKNIGTKRALRIIKKIGSVENLPDKQVGRWSKVFKPVNDEKNISLVKRNVTLVTIPREPQDSLQRSIELPDFDDLVENVNIDGFFLMVDGLEFHSIMKERKDWESLLGVDDDDSGVDLSDFF